MMTLLTAAFFVGLAEMLGHQAINIGGRFVAFAAQHVRRMGGMGSIRQPLFSSFLNKRCGSAALSVGPILRPRAAFEAI